MLLGFKKQFAPKILDGSKRFTIRNPRKREPKIGEQLHMYTGLRTKHTQKITSEHTLKGIQLVDIFIQNKHTEDNIRLNYSIEFTLRITVDGRPLREEEYLRFCIADGFASVSDFQRYWLSEKSVLTQHFQEGQKRPLMNIYKVDQKDLVMYHWTDLRF